MRFFLSFTILLCLCLSVSAQTRAGEYIDVVFFFQGDPVEGTILAYEYGEKLVIVKEDGTVKEFPWEEVKRVNFRYDKRLVKEIAEDRVAEEPTEDEYVLPTPERKFRHQVTSALSFGRTTNNDNGFPFSSTAIGGGFAYHLLRDVSAFTFGAGLDVNLMNHQRQENVLAATALVEVPVGKGRWRPFARFETGPSFPFGTGEEGENITARSITILYHPAVGVEITPRNGGWGKLTLDVGYRFLNSRFSITTSNLDVIERNVNYRRLTLRGGMRF